MLGGVFVGDAECPLVDFVLDSAVALLWPVLHALALASTKYQ